MEFDEHIWNHHENCIQKSTNMPGIGSLNRDITVKISDSEKAARHFFSVISNGHSIKSGHYLASYIHVCHIGYLPFRIDIPRPVTEVRNMMRKTTTNTFNSFIAKT